VPWGWHASLRSRGHTPAICLHSSMLSGARQRVSLWACACWCQDSANNDCMQRRLAAGACRMLETRLDDMKQSMGYAGRSPVVGSPRMVYSAPSAGGVSAWHGWGRAASHRLAVAHALQQSCRALLHSFVYIHHMWYTALAANVPPPPAECRPGGGAHCQGRCALVRVQRCQAGAGGRGDAAEGAGREQQWGWGREGSLWWARLTAVHASGFAPLWSLPLTQPLLLDLDCQAAEEDQSKTAAKLRSTQHELESTQRMLKEAEARSQRMQSDAAASHAALQVGALQICTP